MITAFILFIAGLLLLIYFSEKLVKGVVGTSLRLGVSAFVISVIFIGFDPENLALGSVASYEQAAGIALGTVFGAAMVAMALAFGITALIAPMKFEDAPLQIVIIPVAAVLLIGGLSLDGVLSRMDGMLLMAAFFSSITLMLWLAKRELTITPGGEVGEVLEKKQEMSKAIGLLLISLAAIIAGSKMIVSGSETLLAGIGLSKTVFGMTILALLVSIEELARELPAAIKGRADISYGNVAGSALAFFLFNAGIIALINPIPVSDEVLWFHLPVTLVTILFISACMMFRRINRAAGSILVVLYIFFFAGSYLV